MAYISETPQGRRNDRRLLELKIAKLEKRDGQRAADVHELDFLRECLDDVNKAIANDELFVQPEGLQLAHTPGGRNTGVNDILGVQIDVGDVLVLPTGAGEGVGLYRVLDALSAGRLSLERIWPASAQPVRRISGLGSKSVCLSWKVNQDTQPNALIHATWYGEALALFAAYQKAGPIA